MELRFGGKGGVVLSDDVNELLNKKIEKHKKNQQWRKVQSP